MPALVDATPYWLAARFTQPGVMRLLAKHGADPKVIHESNYVQGEGYQRRKERTTAVMAALGMGGGTAWVPIDRAERDALILETVKVAVELGADVNAASIDGRTALDSARAQKYDAVAAFLEERGAVATFPLRLGSACSFIAATSRCIARLTAILAPSTVLNPKCSAISGAVHCASTRAMTSSRSRGFSVLIAVAIARVCLFVDRVFERRRLAPTQNRLEARRSRGAGRTAASRRGFC